MAGWIDLHVDVIKGGMVTYGLDSPVFKPGPVEPRFSDYLVFEGISVDERTGEQYYLDAHVAYRRACLNAIDYMTKFGFTPEQAYVILGTAPVEGRISGIVDTPNCCCTLYLPSEIFGASIAPTAGGPVRLGSGQVALAS
jgi:formamidase